MHSLSFKGGIPIIGAKNNSHIDGENREIIKKISFVSEKFHSLLSQREISNRKTYYIRHGLTDRNVDKMMNPGDIDSELNQAGEKQALLAGEQFYSQFGNNSDIKIYSSDLKRAMMTAKYWSRGFLNGSHPYILPVSSHSGLREMYAGPLKNKTVQEIKDENNLLNTADIRRFYKTKENNGFESAEEFDHRVVLSCVGILEEAYDNDILIVGHSGVTRPLQRVIEVLPFDFAHYENKGIANSIVFEISAINKKLVQITGH